MIVIKCFIITQAISYLHFVISINKIIVINKYDTVFSKNVLKNPNWMNEETNCNAMQWRDNYTQTVVYNLNYKTDWPPTKILMINHEFCLAV